MNMESSSRPKPKFDISSRWLRALVESALDGVITMDDKGRIISLNPAAEKIFGYSHDQAIGKRLTVVPERCSGCRLCEVVCSLVRFGVNNPKKSCLRVMIAYPHPVIRMPIICHQCREPKCAENCPTDAIEVQDGIVAHIDVLAWFDVELYRFEPILLGDLHKCHGFASNALRHIVLLVNMSKCPVRKSLPLLPRPPKPAPEGR